MVLKMAVTLAVIIIVVLLITLISKKGNSMPSGIQVFEDSPTGRVIYDSNFRMGKILGTHTFSAGGQSFVVPYAESGDVWAVPLFGSSSQNYVDVFPAFKLSFSGKTITYTGGINYGRGTLSSPLTILYGVY